MLLIVVSACTPSPKYRGGGRRKEVERTPAPARQPAPPATAAPVVFAPPLDGYRPERITSRFGPRRHPRYRTSEFHNGVDIDADRGDPVYAAAPGTVSFAGRQRGFGLIVVIDHGERWSSAYAHLGTLAVSVGDRVERGSEIGRVGTSGNATGTHLHFEIRRAGKPLDPLGFL